MKKSIITTLILCAMLLAVLQVSRDKVMTYPAPAAVPEQQSAEAAEKEDSAEFEAGIEEIDKFGNITLTIGADTMQELGYEVADVVRVRAGDTGLEMPIGTAYSDVDSGEPVCIFKKDKNCVDLAINMGSMASALKLAEISRTDADPGYEIIWSEGRDENTSLYLSLAEKQGYAEEYKLHQLTGTISNERGDYSHLTDAGYANFRAVNTTGMGEDCLFRSSSPVDPALNRNKEADKMLVDSMIRTVFNMADSEASMKEYPGYPQTGYSGCDIIALNMAMDYYTDEFRQKLAEGYRFMASHEGPYLIHCKEGKDRTGFAVAVLSCLMGAEADEIVSDYMLTYYNFYGIEPGTEQYDRIADSNIRKSLAKAFGIPSIDEEGVDLAACAEDYLRGLGMTADEITALRNRLSRD